MLVSIIIPTKNRRDLLREALDSLVAQTYRDWEAIVVDDGSVDGTEESVLLRASTESRIRFLRRERRPSGASTCRNIGASAARGEYIIFLDSDDLLAPTCLEHRLKIMTQNPKLDFAVFVTRMFHSNPGDSAYLINNFTDEDDLDRFLRQDVPWQTTGPIWRKSGFAKVGLWDECALSMQDWEFHVRALAAGLTYLKDPTMDSFWRITGSTSITNFRSWGSSRRIWNRVRLFIRIVSILRAQGLLTRRRRRFMAAEYYKHAFKYNDKRRLALKIWTVALREKIIGMLEFNAIMAGDITFRLTRRANESLGAWVFPELRFARSHFMALPPVIRSSKPRNESTN